MYNFLKLVFNENCIKKDIYDKLIKYEIKEDSEVLDMILSNKEVDANKVYNLYATYVGLPRIENIKIDKKYKNLLPLEFARLNQVAIVGENGSFYKLITRTKLDSTKQREIEDKFNIKIEQYIATKNEIEDAIYKIYNEEIIYTCLEKISNKSIEMSAKTVITNKQKFIFVFIAMAIIALILVDWKLMLNITLWIVNVLFVVLILGKIYLYINGTKDTQGTYKEIKLEDIDYDTIKEDELPIYTILVPMYKESEVIQYLVEHIEELDYPKWKLDVRFLLEEDDTETIQAIKDMKLPEYYTMVITPDFKPKTKPKACNYGMINAKGSLVVIYDAEDRPEPQQLKMCVEGFKKLPKEYMCLQGKLNFFNSTKNWITKQFTIEYTSLFEGKLPWLMKINAPILLGGTSNHFKRDILEKVMLWDPYNVTEDADLGIRIFREGYKTAIVDSITWEEANCEFYNWIRQRSRWIKGHMQTWLINMRNPIKLCKEIGIKNYVLLQIMFLERGFIGLFLPALYLVLILWFLSILKITGNIISNSLVIVTILNYIVSGIIYREIDMKVVKDVMKNKPERISLYINEGIYKNKISAYCYWSLLATAAYKALWQLISKPFYWEKTNHGLSNKK